MKRALCVLAAVMAVTVCGGENRQDRQNGQNERNRPRGLMTDLVEGTDREIDGRRALVRSERPSFSWITPEERMQTAYRIVVYEYANDASASVLWDSGTVQSGASTAVAYGGPALEASKTYSWKTKVRTRRYGKSGKGRWSEWSEEKEFRTAEALETYSTTFYSLVKERETALSASRASDGNQLFDFGKDAFGQLEVTLESESEGEQVTVHLGERLADGSILRNPTTTVRYQRHTITLEKGRRSYKIEVTPDKRNTGADAIKMPEYAGEVMPFRYCEIEGCSSALDPRDVARYNVHYPFDISATSFSCDNDILNQVWEMCRYSVQATSFTGIYIDGDRERIPYEADALINQLCHYGADREFSMARRSIDYLLEHPTWPTEWILQTVMMAWNDYLFTGDDRCLREHYNLLKAHCLMALKQENGLISTRAQKQTPELLASINREVEIRDIVDWPQKVPEVDGVPGGSDGFIFTDYNAVVNAYWCHDLSLMSKIAAAIGQTDDAEAFSAEAEAARRAFNKAFFDPASKLYVDGIGVNHSSLHANLFALLFGLVPDKFKEDVTDYIASRGMSCGVYAAQFLLEALYEGGATDAAFKLMSSKAINSWCNMIAKGSTITMEAWDDTFKPNQDWNHIWGAAPGNVIPFRMMGVRPLEPGFSKALIKPQTAGLTSAEMKLPTIRGNIFIKIEKGEGEWSLTVETPGNMVSRVMLPVPESAAATVLVDGRKTAAAASADGFIDLGDFGPGTHRFVVAAQ